MEIKKGITFDDVLLIPKKSSVYSRKDVDVSTRLTKKIKLNIPIISANMDTVTEAKMAVAIAREGGLGIIHRFMPIEQQVNEVLKVKRAENIIIEKPYSILENKKLREAIKLMGDYGVNGLLVVDSENKLRGILTSRDLWFESNMDKSVSEVMTKRNDIISIPYKEAQNIEKAKEILKRHKVEKLPIVDEDYKVKGLITAKDIFNIEKRHWASKDKKGRLLVGAAVGVKEDPIRRTKDLLDAGCDVIVVDIAHGHSDLAINTVKKIKREFDVEVIAGNVATREATEDLISAGADSIKVGVGSGSICITRIVTGSGVPQLTAIMDCSEIARDYGVSIISDGGIRNSGDIVKALAAGANAVMIGNLLAGTEEAPGISIMRNGKKYKFYRGMASTTANIDRTFREGKEIGGSLIDYVGEGVESIVPYRGTVAEVIKQLIGGIKSGFSYCGARNLYELQKNAEFILVSGAAITESRPHDVKEI